MSRASFDREYQQHQCYWGIEPSRIVREALRYKSQGTVLDLGAGEGRNSLFLARAGFAVTAVDIAPHGLEKIARIAAEEELSVRTITADAISLMIDETYDIIVATSLLNLMRSDHVCRLLSNMMHATPPSGLNVVQAFTEGDPGRGFAYLFRPNELRERYLGWNVLAYREYLTRPERHCRGQLHRHEVAEIIAQKVWV